MGKPSERQIFTAKQCWANPSVKLHRNPQKAHWHSISSPMWPSSWLQFILHPHTHYYLLGQARSSFGLSKNYVTQKYSGIDLPLLLQANTAVYKSQVWTRLTYLNYGITWGHPLPHISNEVNFFCLDCTFLFFLQKNNLKPSGPFDYALLVTKKMGKEKPINLCFFKEFR